MSFIARRFATDSVEHCIKPEDLSSSERKNQFYCPGCPCVFLYRSESSNEKAAHFYRHGHHYPGCWMPYAESISGDTEWDVAKDFRIEDFYSSIISSKKRSGGGPGTAGGGSSGVTRKRLSTLRNLYKFCCYHDNDSILHDNVTVKDVLVARKTSYLYTTYVKGIRLIEARYWRYDPEAHNLFFLYPYSAKVAGEARFKIDIKCPKELFPRLRDRVYSTDSVVLLMCDWTFSSGCIHGTLSNAHQLVVL
ncbi:MAG: hypothetical protein E7233_13030 [Lachnospiraceae bacterium]|nr:hypothetical protein [Lachnospiraceae bacterium]